MIEPSLEKAGTDIEKQPETALLERICAQSPARILTGRAGAAYRTNTWLALRRDHAAARDAVTREFELTTDLGPELVAEWGLFEVATLARDKREFLLRPESGRSLDVTAKELLRLRCPRQADLQVAIADGLSAAAVRAQVPSLLPLLAAASSRRGWRYGQPFFIRHGRVGVLNEIGDILDPVVVVLLIGERPGLATAESLSAYMAYRPRSGHDDSRRNLICNIHARGVPPDQAAPRITQLATQMIRMATSGVAVKEEWIPQAQSLDDKNISSLEH
jgi:ethanolamine ammonia-lyase small subunit